MCCGVPIDMYDVVVLGGGPVAFAEAFAEREAGHRVAVVLAGRPLDERLAAAMSRFEINLIEGWPEHEDEHYVDVEGRLIYGERIVDTRSSLARRSGGASIRNANDIAQRSERQTAPDFADRESCR